MTAMRQMADEDMPPLNTLCHGLGMGIVPPLVAAIGPSDSRLAVRRLKDVLIGFGSAAVESARTLRQSSNPAVRRVAIEVLEAVSGDGALDDLEALLGDADPLVQKEAVRAIGRIGSGEAYGVLERAFRSGEARVREAIVQAVGSLGAERAAPLLVSILEHTSPRGPGEATYVAAMEALGRSGADPRGIGALKEALYRGEWWAPFRTARLRGAAARALHSTASAAGDAVLQEASATGSRGIRKAASEAMSSVRRSRSAGGTP
jgi:HEAT repeat protein